MEEDVHEYEGKAVTVTYDVERCIHARECVRGLPAVFDPDRRPWIEPDAASGDELAAVIERCPTGALHYERHGDGPVEATPEEPTVTVARDGPLYARGDVQILDPDGRTLLEDTRVALCRCGASDNKPLCDGTHGSIDFEADGTVPSAGPESVEGEAGLTVTPTRNGPLRLVGRYAIVGEEDGSSVDRSRSTLCRCGGTADMPFCDGTHAEIGFSTDGG